MAEIDREELLADEKSRDYDELDWLIIDALAIDTAVHWTYAQRAAVRKLIDSYAAEKEKAARIDELKHIDFVYKNKGVNAYIVDRIAELQNEREGKSSHEHDWLLAAGDIRYRDTEGEYVIDLYVCECGAGGRVKTPKAMYDRGEKVLGIEDES